MKKIQTLIICFLILNGCLVAKKSPFDINTPSGIFFGLVIASQSQRFSVGGTIIGFKTGTLILQNNGANDLTLKPAETSYSFSGIASSSTYAISVKTHPDGQSCKIENATGTVSGNVSNANIVCSTLSVTALYTLDDATKSYWLDYVKSDGTSPLNATGVACTGTETGYYNACIHTGEFKKIAVPNLTSCDGITAIDSLSAFNWKCVVASDGLSISVISTGLRADKGLTDLIDFTSPGSWRNISVTVQSSGNSLLTSTSGKWWDNPITENNVGGGLGTTKTIYIVNVNTGVPDYRMNTVDKIALIVKPGIVKILNTGGGSAIPMTSKFDWIEGSFSNAMMIVTMISLSSTARFAVLRNVKLTGDPGFTIGIMTTSASNLATYLHNIRASNLAVGLHLNSNGVLLNQVNANNCNDCIRVFQSDMIILNSLAFNGSGIAAFESSSNGYNSNFYANNTSANHNLGGFSLSTGAGNISRTTYQNTLSVNNGSGIINNDSLFTKYINLVTANNNTSQFTENGTSTNSIFNGVFKVSGAVCSNMGTASGVGASCNKLNGSETTPPTITGITLASSFIGKVTSTDTNNTSNANGVSVGIPTDWLNFINFFRGFGNEGGAFPVSANRSNCTTNCRIWDWSLKSTDSVVRNVNACPNGTIVDTHQWSGAAANQTYCNDNYKGSSLSAGFCVTTFLRNAVEIFGDGVGNENGICESNEECLFTPNIGAYQGHSSDSTNPTKLIPASQTSATTNVCPDITTGTVTNVKLWKYDTNGY